MADSEQVEKEAGSRRAVNLPDGHRVRVHFDRGYVGYRLICPEGGGCNPATVCASCAADLTDPESKRCYDCPQGPDDRCWLQTWFDDAPEEYIDGEIEFPITAEWDSDHPVLTATQPVSETPNAR